MSIRLFQFWYSPYVEKVRAALAIKGIAFETVEVPYLDRKELVARSGQVAVPVLEWDGEVVADSGRILAFLEGRKPTPALFPPEAAGLCEMLSEWLDNDLEDKIFRLAAPAVEAWQRARGAEQAAMWRYVRERKFGPGCVDRWRSEAEEHWRALQPHLERLDRALAGKEFLLGPLTAADCSLYGQMFFLGHAREIPEGFPNLRAHYARMKALGG